MRSKAPLVLMEQMVMLLVFALAAALCLQAFVKSDAASRRSEARDHAVILAQNAAETIRYYGGDMGNALSQASEELGVSCAQGLLWQDYDEDWNPDNNGVYRLLAQGVPTDVPGLWVVRVEVLEGESPEPLFSIEVAWQEEE